MSPKDFFSTISMSEEYQSFRGSIPLKNITVEEDKTWQVFDTGPRGQGNSPLRDTVTSKILFVKCNSYHDWQH